MNKNKLITSLRIAAKALQNGTFCYDWKTAESCNCGVLACAILGKSREELADMLPFFDSDEPGTNSWKDMVGRVCPVTGMSQHAVFKALFEAGMTAEDIVQLENLSNPKVLGEMTTQMETVTVQPGLVRKFFGGKPKTILRIPKHYYDDRASAAWYMRAWADLLQKENAVDSASVEVTPTPPQKPTHSEHRDFAEPERLPYCSEDAD